MDFSIDIWRVISRHALELNLLWVCRNSRKGLFNCYEFWAFMFPHTIAFYRSYPLYSYGGFCMYYFIEGRRYHIQKKLKKVWRAFRNSAVKSERIFNIKEMQRLERKICKRNPFENPVKVSETRSKKIIRKMAKKRRIN
jgi:hypothetical protein